MAPLIDRLIGPAIGRYLAALSQNLGSIKTNAGSTIGNDTPFELVAPRAAIGVLSSDVAALPLKLYRQQDRSRIEVTDHPLSKVLRQQPNSRQTAFELAEMRMVALLTWGNFYAWKQYDASGRVTGLWPLRPDNVTVHLTDTGDLLYRYEPSDHSIPPAEFTSSQILHIKGLSTDGLVGRTPLYDFREKLGENAATESMTQSFYGNGMKRSVVFKMAGKLSDQAHERLTRDLADKSGPDKAWKPLLLEEGMDFSELSFAPEDAQLLDSRRFTIEDWCRIYNLPPYKLRLNTPGTVSYASVDAQTVDYLVSTLTPWLVRVEQAITVSCLTPAERAAGYFVEHNTRALLRSDLKTQAEALEIGRNAGWYSINDCRDKLGENPVDDPRADDYFAPTYVQSTTAQLESPDDESDDSEPDDETDTVEDDGTTP